VIHVLYGRYKSQEEKECILQDLEELRKEIERHE
jgi:hypothetical protein